MPRKAINTAEAYVAVYGIDVGVALRLIIFGVAVAATPVYLTGCTAPPGVAPPSGPTRIRPPSAPAAPAGKAMSGSPTTLDTVPAVPTESLLPSPTARSEGFYYEVQIGDTLESVAAQYRMNPVELRRANGLDPDTAPRAGQLLFIPAGRNPGARDR